MKELGHQTGGYEKGANLLQRKAPFGTKLLGFSLVTILMKNISIKLVTTLIALFGFVAVYAEELSVINQEVRIPKGESKRFNFGTVPQMNTTVLLDIMTRQDSDGCGGSMYFMKLSLNGRPITAAKTRTLVRLLNKPVISPVLPGVESFWAVDDRWRVIYAPDFKKGLEQAFYTGNPYQLTFDVTDLTNPLAENHLEITNLCEYSAPVGSKHNLDLVIKSLVVRTKPVASSMMTKATRDQNFINRGEPGRGSAKYEGKLCSGGGFVITTGGQRFDFASAFSYPNAGLNRLLPTDRQEAGQKGWTVKVEPTADGGLVVGEGPDYRLRRTVRFTARKVEVSEEITNLHRNQKLGMLINTEMSIQGKQGNVRLAGSPDPMINECYAPPNPSVYFQQKDTGIGLICEDDVFRNQATLFCDVKAMTVGMRTDKLCLQPGGSYTLQWSVYPVATNDYYDFINLVRQDWGANYTVQGAWSFFFNPDPFLTNPVEYLRMNYTRLGIKFVNYCGGWIDFKRDPKKIGFGTGVLEPYWADFRDRLRQAGKLIHEAMPDSKFYCYYDSFRETSDDTIKRFPDSLLTTADGKPFTYISKDYNTQYYVIATLDNSYGRAMLAAVDRYMNEIKADGLYWDEMEGGDYTMPMITYNMRDGYSCILTKQYTIDREVAIHSILGEAHRLAVIDRVRSLGGDILGNGPCCTKKILSRKPQRMVEIQHNDGWFYQGNLNSPLGYAGGESPRDLSWWIRSLKMATLLVGTSHDYEYDISRYTFPFTPIELHSGYLLGQERIITVHSGNYGWSGNRCLVQVRHFGKKGKLTNMDFPTTVASEARTKVELADGEALVLERLPVTVEPKSGTAKVSGVSYSSDGLSFSLKAPDGAKVQVTNGTLSLAADRSMLVSTGGTCRELVVGKSGMLEFDVKSTETVKVEVKPMTHAAKK